MSRNPPPDPYLQWLLNVLVKQMNKQGSPFYLPQLILNQSNPAYEPYTIDGEWSIPSSAQLQQAGDPICVATIPSDIENLYQAIASRPPNVTLAGPTTLKFQGALPFRVSGISNVIAQSAVVDYGEHASAEAIFGQIPTWRFGANGITLTGNYKIHQACCASVDGEACASGAPNWTEDSYGTFSVTLKKPKASIAGTAYADGKYLQFNIEKLSLTASLKPEDIVASVTIATITDPNLAQMWQSLANAAVGDPSTIKTVLENLHEILNSEKTRRDIGDVINQNLRKLIDGGFFAAFL